MLRGLFGPGCNCSVRRRIASEQFVEFAFGIELKKIVGTTDMRAIDEDLRHGVSTRSFHHGLPVSWIFLDI
jgi:hypothetical protein